MKQIQLNYIIEKNTIALIPVKKVDFYTVALTTLGKVYVKQTPFEIIKKSCLEEFVTYEGRKNAVQKLTNFKNKVPIPISTSRNIFSFPTISPVSPDCVWLFYHHIKGVEEDRKKNPSKSIIHFINGTSLELDISHYILQQQFYKTAVCKNMFDIKMQTANE
ncbi:competence protein ComK [Oceanobacillus sp. CAU 1775]